MFLPILASQNQLMKVTYANQLLELNEKTKAYGLTLTEENVKHVIESRSLTLKSYERIELGINVTKRIVELFSSSPYVRAENYVNIITEIQEIFYYYKNETNEKVSDEALINIINKYFNMECEGSIQLLKGKMEEYAKKTGIEQMNQELLDQGRDIYERKHK